jgi:hypothetical protein
VRGGHPVPCGVTHQCTRGKTQQISTRGIQKITERIRTRCKTTNMPLQMSTRSGGGDGIKTRIKSGRLKRSTYGKEVVYSITPQTTKAKAIPKKKKNNQQKETKPKNSQRKKEAVPQHFQEPDCLYTNRTNKKNGRRRRKTDSTGGRWRRPGSHCSRNLVHRDTRTTLLWDVR